MKDRWSRLLSLAFVLGLAAYLISTCLWTVARDEQGIVVRFGRVDRVVLPGIQFTLPWPIERLERVNTNETRVMSVGFRSDDADATVTRNEAEWVTGDTNIVEINLTLNYRVSDPLAYAFRHVGSEAEFLLRKSAESALTRRVATMGVDEVLTSGRGELRDAVLTGVREDMTRYETGLELLTANIEVDPPGNLKFPFGEVQDATKEVESMLQNADGTRLRILQQAESEVARLMQEAKSYRDNVVSAAESDAASFLTLLQEYERTPRIVKDRLLLERFKRISESGPRVVWGSEGVPVKFKEVR